jgi:hypothetical protein
MNCGTKIKTSANSTSKKLVVQWLYDHVHAEFNFVSNLLVADKCPLQNRKQSQIEK